MSIFLNSIAAEMKIAADRLPMSASEHVKNVFSRTFPEELKRNINLLEFGNVCVQFSLDELHLPEDKTSKKKMYHLSFSREDKQVPDEKMKAVFREAFFGQDKDAFFFPSIISSFIIHIVKIFER